MLVCTACRQPLPAMGTSPDAAPMGEIECRFCGAWFDCLNRVPVIARGARITDRRRPGEAFVNDLAAIIAPTLPASVHNELADIFSHSVTFGSLHLQVEADQFLQRLVSSGCRLAPMYDDAEPVAATPAAVPANSDIRLALALTITPRRIAAGRAFSIQLHVTNDGASRLESFGDAPVMISSFCTPAGEPDAPPLEGSRTPLLIDLDPGMRITMPVTLHAPDRAGRYRFQVAALQEHVRWFLDGAVTFETEAVEAGDPCAVDWPRGTILRDYGEDHLSGVALLHSWLARYVPTPEPILLELGGNANPMVAGLPGTKFNVDIDAFGLAFGEVRQRVSGGGDVRYVAADGTDLPFADGLFDCVCLFATFHHFPDPVALLRHLRTKLNPNGLLCLLCEPIGHVFRGPQAEEFLGELRRGVNEQSFELWEYRDMLDVAGYEAVDVLIDVGSLKLAARPRR